ncbi:MAG: DNA-directed RNA polymerase subunit alpha [Planctomycetota bacterium]|nr:MAG: DNA-directed RNA polymerase subunit alpha [Planctomycetota bacterium]
MRLRWKGFEFPTSMKVDKSKQTSTYGRFSVEPFGKGFGTTIGNCLRRILLAYIKGAAPTWLKIKGVMHEFSTVDGVLEDVTDIVLNVKSIRLKIETDDEVVLTIKKSGKGVVTAADIVCSHEVEVINKNLVICTITDDIELDIEIGANSGRGYVTVEEKNTSELPAGTIALDSRYSPISLVKWSVSETRVGQKTNYDRLELEVWTDGSIEPRIAIIEAATILKKHINVFTKYFEVGDDINVEKDFLLEDKSESESEKKIIEKFKMLISSLDLSVRTANCLASENIITVGQLISKTENELLKVRSFGKTSLNELKAKLNELELTFGMNVPPEYR